MRTAAQVLGTVVFSLGQSFLGLLLGLEVLYLRWLPADRPERPVRPLPAFVRQAVWVEFEGGGQPHLTAEVPYLTALLRPLVASISGERHPPGGGLLLHASRSAMRRPMQQTEFLARWLALSTWLSRNWNVEEVIDYVGETIWLGEAGHGLPAGARHYFGKPLEALTIEEVALLLAVARSPRAYDPACRPGTALRGRSDVLERMSSAGLIDENALGRAAATQVRVLPACEHPLETHGRPAARRDPCHP